jgi:hypothetical protein
VPDQSPWIDEHSRPAPRQETVIVCDCHFKGRVFVATKNALGEWREGWSGGDMLNPPPTHWMPIPAVPDRLIN